MTDDRRQKMEDRKKNNTDDAAVCFKEGFSCFRTKEYA